jgi:energy-converting hydrogenase Eha subunit A
LLLFFVPVLKLFFFAVLCLVPAPVEANQRTAGSKRSTNLLRVLIPRSGFGSAVLAIAVTLVLAVVATWLGTSLFGNYGWSLFVGLPFFMGFLSVLMYCVHERRSFNSCLLVANGTVLLAGAALLLFAMEGVLCLVMAAPLAFVIGSVGGAVAFAIQDMFRGPEESSRLFCAAILAVPMAMGLENTVPPPLRLLEVKSWVVVDAPPEKVWRNVVSFAELPPPRELIFKLGVAYPVRAGIRGQGVGAVRHCNFSTGPFVEPIEVWDEPRLLKFSVTRNPDPMQEWTPYRNVHPAHLDGYLESRAGQFRLVALGGGRTLLEGTTWYHHHMWPADYWQIWSDHIIHTIHLRVLNHVKKLSERKEP